MTIKNHPPASLPIGPDSELLITQLVAAVDLQRLLDDCMVPALMAKGEAEGSLATAVVTGLSGCLDRSVPSADAAFGAALSAFAALRSVPASLLTMSRVDDIVGLLSRVPSGLLTPVIETIVATQGCCHALRYCLCNYFDRRVS